MVNKLVIIGPAWPLRGGLSAFDEKLATEFTEKGIQTRIDTFSLQYPNILQSQPVRLHYPIYYQPASYPLQHALHLSS